MLKNLLKFIKRALLLFISVFFAANAYADLCLPLFNDKPEAIQTLISLNKGANPDFFIKRQTSLIKNRLFDLLDQKPELGRFIEVLILEIRSDNIQKDFHWLFSLSFRSSLLLSLETRGQPSINAFHFHNYRVGDFRSLKSARQMYLRNTYHLKPQKEAFEKTLSKLEKKNSEKKPLVFLEEVSLKVLQLGLKHSYLPFQVVLKTGLSQSISAKPVEIFLKNLMSSNVLYNLKKVSK